MPLCITYESFSANCDYGSYESHKQTECDLGVKYAVPCSKVVCWLYNPAFNIAVCRLSADFNTGVYIVCKIVSYDSDMTDRFT